uniref:Uncharacterized protein n=1 Tax=Arabidopsis thaliana TaxID=3702 RepID=Q0WLI3_ARATH|nr:hypothetical protein [Arabidopsis thaliana]
MKESFNNRCDCEQAYLSVLACMRFLLQQQLLCEKQEKGKLQLCDITSLAELEERIYSTRKPSQKVAPDSQAPVFVISFLPRSPCLLASRPRSTQ